MATVSTTAVSTGSLGSVGSPYGRVGEGVGGTGGEGREEPFPALAGNNKAGRRTVCLRGKETGNDRNATEVALVSTLDRFAWRGRKVGKDR